MISIPSEFRDLLSDEARRAVDAAGLTRDPALTCDPATLEALLRARGAPVYASALDLERLVGGVSLAGTTILGCFAALERRRREPIPRDDELLSYEGARLLPIDGSMITAFWIDRQGTIHHGYFGDVGGDPDGEDWCEPVYESVVKLFERWALQREPWWPRDPALALHDPPYAIRVDAELGEAIADALEVPFAPAPSDRFVAVFRSDAHLILDRHHFGRFHVTEAWVPRLDDVVAILALIARRAPSARVEWFGPKPAEPGPSDPLVHDLVGLRYRGAPRDVRVFGRPGDYRVEGW